MLGLWETLNVGQLRTEFASLTKWVSVTLCVIISDTLGDGCQPSALALDVWLVEKQTFWFSQGIL